MGKRFIKFRVSRVIPSFQSCRPKHPSALPPNPIPSFPHRLNHFAPSTAAAIATLKLNHQPHPSSSTPKHSSLKRHVSSALLSARRSLLGPSSSSSSSCSRRPISTQSSPPDCHNYPYTPPRRKIYTSATTAENDVVLFPPLQLNNRTRRRSSCRKLRSFQKVRLSTSSDSGMIFSEDDDNNNKNNDNNNNNELETDTLVTTTDESSTEKKKKRMLMTMIAAEEEEGAAAPARLSEFMRRMVLCKAAVEGKVRESFAVVKKSEDPYEDFKRSMAEMVVEKQMFEAPELEELLHCFLSLNSPHHHDSIVRAFTHIWEALFTQQEDNNNPTHN